jgi:hypothetical protein
MMKVQELYASPDFQNLAPVAGAKAGLQALKHAGYRIEIVTARGEAQQAMTEQWLHSHYPGENWRMIQLVGLVMRLSQISSTAFIILANLQSMTVRLALMGIQ